MDRNLTKTVVRVSTTVWPRTKKALKEFAAEKRLPGADEALNRLVEFYSPTDSKVFVNHLLFDCSLAFAHLPNPDDRIKFCRYLYGEFDEFLAMIEEKRAEKESADDGLKRADKSVEAYKEHPFWNTRNLRLLKERAPFSVNLGGTNFQTLKSSGDAMGMSVGELIDLLALGYPGSNDPEEQSVGVETFFCIGMSRLSRGQYLESLGTLLDILGFLVDAGDGSYTPEDAGRVLELLHSLSDSGEAELFKLRKWKYDHSIATAFSGFFPDLFEVET